MTQNKYILIALLVILLLCALYIVFRSSLQEKKDIVEIATPYGIVKLDNPGDDYEYVGNESGGVYLPKDKSKRTYGTGGSIDKVSANGGGGGRGILEYSGDVIWCYTNEFRVLSKKKPTKHTHSFICECGEKLKKK